MTVSCLAHGIDCLHCGEACQARFDKLEQKAKESKEELNRWMDSACRLGKENTRLKNALDAGWTKLNEAAAQAAMDILKGEIKRLREALKYYTPEALEKLDLYSEEQMTNKERARDTIEHMNVPPVYDEYLESMLNMAELRGFNSAKKRAATILRASKSYDGYHNFTGAIDKIESMEI